MSSVIFFLSWKQIKNCVLMHIKYCIQLRIRFLQVCNCRSFLSFITFITMFFPVLPLSYLLTLQKRHLSVFALFMYRILDLFFYIVHSTLYMPLFARRLITLLLALTSRSYTFTILFSRCSIGHYEKFNFYSKYKA
jgi:hypothetical protein